MIGYPSGYSIFIVNWKAEPIALAIGVDAKTYPASWATPRQKSASPGHLRPRHRRYTAADGPGDGHLHDRDLRKGADTMAKRRKPGSGNQIGDHLWEGRYSPGGRTASRARNVYGHIPEECEEKLSSDCRHESERNSADAEFFLSVVFLLSIKTAKFRALQCTKKLQKQKVPDSCEIRNLLVETLLDRTSDLLRVEAGALTS